MLSTYNWKRKILNTSCNSIQTQEILEVNATKTVQDLLMENRKIQKILTLGDFNKYINIPWL